MCVCETEPAYDIFVVSVREGEEEEEEEEEDGREVMRVKGRMEGRRGNSSLDKEGKRKERER